MMLILRATFLLLMMSFSVKADQTYPRPRLLQDHSCYYEPFRKSLTCECDGQFPRAFLLLKLGYNIREAGQEIRYVRIQSCIDLLLSLDLEGVDPTSIPINIRKSQKVKIDHIKFEQSLSKRQILSLNFDNVNTVEFDRVLVEEAIKLQAKNVKHLLIRNSEMAIVPERAIQVEQARKLEIVNSHFPHVYPSSIEVEKVKEVLVINNEFNVNAIEVVSAKDGSLLYISCNRLVGEIVSPECVTTSTPAFTTAAISTTQRNDVFARALPDIPTSTELSADQATDQGEEKEAASDNNENENIDEVKDDEGGTVITELANQLMLSREILIGIGAGILAIVLLLVCVIVWLCCRNRRSNRRPDGKQAAGTSQGDPELQIADYNSLPTGAYSTLKRPTSGVSHPNGNPPLADTEPEEEEAATRDQRRLSDLVLGEEPSVELVEPTRPKLSTPIWLQEIHSNRIFNKQKSIINESEGQHEPKPEDASLAAGGQAKDAVDEQEPLLNNNNDGEKKDDVPRRKKEHKVRIPVRSISEILETDDEDVTEALAEESVTLLSKDDHLTTSDAAAAGNEDAAAADKPQSMTTSEEKGEPVGRQNDLNSSGEAEVSSLQSDDAIAPEGTDGGSPVRQRNGGVGHAGQSSLNKTPTRGVYLLETDC